MVRDSKEKKNRLRPKMDFNKKKYLQANFKKG